MEASINVRSHHVDYRCAWLSDRYYYFFIFLYFTENRKKQTKKH